MEKKIPVRSEADPKYTWALEDVYANNDVWKADLEKARALPAQLAAYKGHLGDSAQKLLEFLQLGDGISVLFDSLYGYAQRRSDEDTANSTWNGCIWRNDGTPRPAYNRIKEVLIRYIEKK